MRECIKCVYRLDVKFICCCRFFRINDDEEKMFLSFKCHPRYFFLSFIIHGIFYISKQKANLKTYLHYYVCFCVCLFCIYLIANEAYRFFLVFIFFVLYLSFLCFLISLFMFVDTNVCLVG